MLLASLHSLVRNLFRRERVERELGEEIVSYLNHLIDEKIAAGLSPAEARRAALIELGGGEQVKEQVRAARTGAWLEQLWHDVRCSPRVVRRNPGFAVVAVLSLGLGIGANAAIFSLINTALLRPLPVRAPDQLVALSNTSGQRMFPTFSYPNYKDVRDRNQVLSGLFGYRYAPLSLSHDGINERLWGFMVTGNYFAVLGVPPALGRVISVHDDDSPGANPVAVLSDKCWKQRFGADTGVVGKNVIVNGRSFSIIGVAAPGFRGTELISAPEMFFPITMQAALDNGVDSLEERGAANLFVQGRLREGISMAQAAARLNATAAELEREFPEFNEGLGIKLSPVGLTAVPVRGALMSFTWMLMAVVGLVLLIACTNLANLLLARSAERRREIAVRIALGASRARLVRQLLSESVLLAIAGGALGCVLAAWVVELASLVKPPLNVPLSVELYVDYRVFLFAAALSLLAGVMFGLLPALRATRDEPMPALNDGPLPGGSGKSWLQRNLIVLQIALSGVLLVGGGLMLRALSQAQTVDLGFNVQGAVEASFDLRLQGYDESRGREFQRLLLERVRALPGVEAAGLADLVPVDLHFSRASIFIEGRAEDRLARVPMALTSRISPGYLAAMQTRLIQGRDFTEQDDLNAPLVAVVNQAFADRFWPGEDPIGRRFSVGRAAAGKYQVVGVAQNGKYAGLNEDARPFVYRPLAQSAPGSTYLIVRSPGNLSELIALVRRELQAMDPNLPASTLTLLQKMDFPLLPARIAASVFGGFGILGLALAAVGIYGVVSYSISRRTREIGVRMALGARRSDVLWLVIGHGMRETLVGIILGLLGALAVSGLMKSLLFGVSATDPVTFGAVAALLAGVALLACYVPARRASRVDPMVALRCE